MAGLKIKLSYKVRNILTLSTLVLLVISIGGYYAFKKYPAQLQVLDKQMQDLQQQVDALEFVGVQLEEAQQQIETEQIKLASIDKQIVGEVSSATTYRYLNNILALSGVLQFDMIFLGVEKKKKFSQNIYNVKGEGSFSAIYRFISFIEKGPQTYKVRKVHLRGVESVDAESGEFEFVVTFEMEILALFARVEDLPTINRTLRSTSVDNARNPFYPVIRKSLPPNYYDLLEVERAELRAIMPDKAFVVDHNRNTHVLMEGDEVYLGFVKKIDEQNQRVLFTLDKGGIIEEFELKLRFNGEQNEERKQ